MGRQSRTMHRYNTRYQLRTAAVQKAAVQKVAVDSGKPTTQAIHPQSEDICSHNCIICTERMQIRRFLYAAEETTNAHQRISVILRLFHYMEHNHTILKSHPKLLNVVKMKIQEINDTVQRDKKRMEEETDWSKKMCQIPVTILREQLKESSDRLSCIIKDF
jgi:hypothetical protein